MKVEEFNTDQKIRFLFAQVYSDIKKACSVEHNDIGIWDEYASVFTKGQRLLDLHDTDFLALVSNDGRMAFVCRFKEQCALFFESFENSERIGIHYSGYVGGCPVHPFSSDKTTTDNRPLELLLEAYVYQRHYNQVHGV